MPPGPVLVRSCDEELGVEALEDPPDFGCDELEEFEEKEPEEVEELLVEPDSPLDLEFSLELFEPLEELFELPDDCELFPDELPEVED